MTDRVTWAQIGQELRPYPGRDWMVLRIVVAVLLAATLVMALRIPSGWLSLYFCFVFAKPTTKQTVITTLAVTVVSLPVILISMLMLKAVAEPDWLRLLVLTAVLYGTFFVANIMTEGDIVRNLTILFATVLTFPDVYPQPYMWEEATLWLLPMILAGVLPLLLVTFIIRPEHVLPASLRPPMVKYGLLADRWTNPEHQVYALKCTFAAMGTYVIYTALNFQEIQTALMTCLVLALPTTEQIIHKTWLRITGAVIGAAMAMGAAIWLIPLSNQLWLLFAVVGAGSALAAWVTLSSPRISYAGRQMALAQFMLVTHAFGPATDLSVLRDRLLGILLGNIMMGLTFKYLWPQKDRAPGALGAGSGLPLVAIGFLVLLLAGCSNSEELAPQTPSHPWRSARAAEYNLPPQYATASASTAPVPDPQHEYTLSELADLALRYNPTTRVAWEQARASAAAVGMSESAYYPQVNLIVAAGYEHIPSPLPTALFPKGYFYSDMGVIRPELQVNWLLWDFGRRGAGEARAREQSAAQNFAFNASLQQVLFSVCESYYKLVSIRSSLKVAEASLDEAKLVEQVAQESLEQGFATRTDVLQAQQMVAQTQFDLAVLRAEQRKAELSLAESIGLDPTQTPKIFNVTTEALPEGFEQSVDVLVARALASRPDLRARVAELRAAESSVDEADAQWLPQLVLSGNVGPIYTAFSVEDTPWVSTFEAQYGVELALKWSLFDGFQRRNMKIAALAQKRQIEAAIAQARNAAVRQVWSAYTDFENAREQLRAAEALVVASEASAEATLASLKQGFATVTDMRNQQTSLAQARASYNQARTDIFLSAALLQFATGRLSAETVVPRSFNND